VSSVRFQVERRCAAGECPAGEGRCRCLDPFVEVDVDELLEVEVRAFALRGTPAQRALVAEYSTGHPTGAEGVHDRRGEDSRHPVPFRA
jgi:hypothetical protein